VQVGDLVKQKKTLFGGPSPILLVIALCRDGETVRTLYAEREWLFSKESLEIVNESR
jgi:hypothetical protein